METSAYCSHCQGLQTVTIEDFGRCKQLKCGACGCQWTIENRGSRKDFSVRMQSVAIEKIYPQVWPNYSIIEVDTLPSELAKRLDIGGIDKVLFANDGHIIQIGQRFREGKFWDNHRYRDLTIREAELRRHLAAMRNGGAVPTFYVYGYATKDEKDFRRLFIIQYPDWLEGIGQTHRPQFKEPRKRGQERFYYEPWSLVPNQYIVFTYPITERQLPLAL